MIVLGTLLLMLPISSRDGISTGVLPSVFTATSASCVTGLVVFDTYQHWSLFGQLVIIILIQIGGLGFITIGTFFSIYLRQNIGLIARERMQESVSALQVGGMVALSKKIIKRTAIVELFGALLLSVRFIPRMGFLHGIYYSLFHSVSAFCNAGFDLMGRYEEYSSFVYYRDDLYMNIVLCALILIGGLGFLVWDDILKKGFNFKMYELHTKLVLVGLVIFTVLGTLLFYVFERNGVLSGLDPIGQFSASLFGAVTPRTAGFNTTDTGALTPGGSLLTLFLMLVGGNPGSTAGGAKVTTILVLYLFVWASLHQSSQVEVFGRRLTQETVRKASVVFTINLSLSVIAAMVIVAVQKLDLVSVLFETFSALNTVGMTCNLTRDLLPVSQVVIILLMYFGRIGSMTFAFSFLRKKDTDIIKSPVAEITVG